MYPPLVPRGGLVAKRVQENLLRKFAPVDGIHYENVLVENGLETFAFENLKSLERKNRWKNTSYHLAFPLCRPLLLSLVLSCLLSPSLALSQVSKRTSGSPFSHRLSPSLAFSLAVSRLLSPSLAVSRRLSPSLAFSRLPPTSCCHCRCCSRQSRRNGAGC